MKISKLYLCILVTSLVSSQPFTANASDENTNPTGPYQINLEDTGRPASPYPALNNYNRRLDSSGVGQSYTVPVSRHHIIPYNVLRTFYNNVIRNGHILHIRSFFSTFGNNIGRYASGARINCSPIFNDLSSAASLAISIGNNIVINGGNSRPEGWDTFEGFYAWMPWNLFIGPNRRTDDPREGFEDNARYIVQDDERFDRMQRLFQSIQNYNDNHQAYELRSIVDLLTRLSNRQSIYPLNSSQWILEHEQGNQPHYRINNNQRQPRSVDNFINDINPKSNDTCSLIKPSASKKNALNPFVKEKQFLIKLKGESGKELCLSENNSSAVKLRACTSNSTRWNYTKFGQIVLTKGTGVNTSYRCLTNKAKKNLTLNICDIKDKKQQWTIKSSSGSSTGYELHGEGTNYTALVNKDDFKKNIVEGYVQFSLSIQSSLGSTGTSALEVYPTAGGNIYVDNKSNLKDYKNYYNAHFNAIFSNYAKGESPQQVVCYKYVDRDSGTWDWTYNEYCNVNSNLKRNTKWRLFSQIPGKFGDYTIRAFYDAPKGKFDKIRNNLLLGISFGYATDNDYRALTSFTQTDGLYGFMQNNDSLIKTIVDSFESSKNPLEANLKAINSISNKYNITR